MQVSLYASEILAVSVGEAGHEEMLSSLCADRNLEAGREEMLTSLCADRNLELCQVSKLFVLTVSVTAVEVDAF